MNVQPFVHGVELVDGTARLAAMNLILHGIGSPGGESLIEVRAPSCVSASIGRHDSRDADLIPAFGAPPTFEPRGIDELRLETTGWVRRYGGSRAPRTPRRSLAAMPQHAPDELDPGVDWITTREVAELLGVPGDCARDH